MRLHDFPTSTLDTSDQSRILVGEAFGTHIADAIEDERLGVMVEATPAFSPATLIEALDDQTSYSVGIAFVGIEEVDVETLPSLYAETKIRATDELSTAIKWRNQTQTEFTWDGGEVPDRIVVFVRGDPPKLGSLHRLSRVPLGQVREAICNLMAARDEYAGNQPSQAVWDALADDIGANLDIRTLAEYAVSCLKPTDQASIDALGQQLGVLGLFVDSQLLEDSTQVGGRLQKNAELRSRSVHVTNRDRKRLINSIKQSEEDDEKSQDDQAAFIDRLRRFQRTSDESLLKDLEFDRVRDAFSTTSQRVPATIDEDGGSDSDGTDDESGQGQSRSQYDRRSDDASVGVELAFDDKQEELESLAGTFDEAIEEGIEKNETKVEFDYDDESKVQVDIHSDLSHFLTQFVTTDRYGGIVRGGDSRDEALTEFTTHDTEYFTVDNEDGSFEKLRSFAEHNADFNSVVESFDSYIYARDALIDSVPALVHSPLLRLLGDPEMLEAADAYLEHYQKVQNKLDKKYRALQDASAQGARRLLSDFLLLDTVILETERGQELMLSPLHPLHLWKYVELAKEVTERIDTLSDEDKEFLQETVEEQPHVLSNITIGGGRLIQEETYFIQSSEEATLPVYTEADRAEPGDNKYLWEYLIEKFSAAYPPSKQHLKITVVDPVEPHQLLTSIADAVEDELLDGATVEYAFVNREQKSLLAGTTTAEEETIINLFGPEGDTDAFSILTRECRGYESLVDHLADHQKHVVVVNDQSAFFIEEFERDMNTSINPLYVPKEYEYDAFEDEINISASTEGRLFSEYQDLVNQRKNQRQKLHNAGVHELTIDEEVVSQLEDHAIWTCLSAPSMNSDPFWEQDLISKERRGDRDYAIYSKDIDLFTRTLQRILNEYPLAPEEADVQQIAERIASTERSGLLRLITEETLGGQQSRNSKGLLGSIIAVYWLEETYEDPKLIFSIDDPRTRRWLNFGESSRRADFVVLQPDAQNGLEMEIVEVKSLDEPDQAFRIEKEDGDHVVRGKAAEQLSETTNTIRSLFEGDDNITTPPRREALREQLYYELIGRDVPGSKSDWVGRVNSVFRGEEQLKVTARIASVEINNQSSSESTTECVTDEVQNLRVTRLPKSTVVRLIMTGTDEFETTDDTTSELEEDDPEASVTDEAASPDDGEEQQSGGEEQQPAADEAAEATDADSEPDDETDSQPQFGEPEAYAEQVESLKRVLHDFGIDIDDIDASDVEVGPNLVRYKVELASGQKQGPLESRSEDIARELALEREPYVHRLPGTNYVAVDVPREETDVVHIEDYLSGLPSRDGLTLSELPFIAGIEPAGTSYISALDEAPHMLVGGTTGSGKTVFLYSLLTCFLETFEPDELRLAIVDPKLTNFMFCNQLPNLEHEQVITESQDAAELFEWITEEEIPRRTQVLSESGSIDIRDHNERSDEPVRPLVVIIDEYADLIDGLDDRSDEFEKNVRRIAQKARSVGIHLVISTQRPSAEIIDTDLRANLDMRVAFRLPSASDSQVILDESGAEELGGNGDMLFKETDSLTRLQGTLVEPDYLRDVIEDISN
jgi:DNA segregation ATPase FtsK/SpoIIIE-like protein